MNYFYSDGNSEVMGPYSKEEIVEFYCEGVISTNAIVCVEGTQQWSPIRGLITSADVARRKPKSAALDSMPRTNLQPATQVQRWANGAQASAYLDSIRQNSCYPTLRSVITIITVLSFLALVILAIGPFLVSSESGDSKTAIFYCLGTLIVGSVTIIAWRQATLLLVDLVDSQLEKNARM